MEMRIVEYTAVVAENKSMLEKLVAELIRSGWQPFHGIAVSQSDGPNNKYDITFAQAMVKYGAGAG